MPLTPKTSYITISDANIYFQGVIEHSDWDNATSAQQNAALIQAASMIDQLDYKGDYLVKVDPISGTGVQQEHEFPRDYQPQGVPNEVLYCNAELALALLQGWDANKEIDNLTVVTEGYDSVRTSYDRSTVPLHLKAGMPMSAFQWITLHLRDPKSIVLTRVS